MQEFLKHFNGNLFDGIHDIEVKSKITVTDEDLYIIETRSLYNIKCTGRLIDFEIVRVVAMI